MAFVSRSAGTAPAESDHATAPAPEKGTVRRWPQPGHPCRCSRSPV